MAYSDYGGYAYRNGVRVVERSDYTLTPDGKGFESPGLWPGFTAIAKGMTKEQIEALRAMPSGHAVLGDGPIFVTLYKQSTLHVYRIFDEVPTLTIAKDLPSEAIYRSEWEGKKYEQIDQDYFKRTEGPCVMEVDGHTITVYWREEDNHYQYVKLEQPDGTVWHGWSGYGVGAGLEDCGYGYSTQEREDVMCELFRCTASSRNAGSASGGHGD